MDKQALLAIHAYVSKIASLNGVDVSHIMAGKQFAVAPTVSQTLEKEIQNSAEFLGLVNHVTVKQQSGNKLGLGITSSIAGRTDTTNNDRTTRSLSDVSGRTYTCEKTDYDTHLEYELIDAWSEFPEFQQMVRDLITRQQGLDRITIGWNGTSVAADTDRVTNPLLQDVNIGWMEKLLLEAPERYLKEGAVANEVRVGVGDATAGYGDFKNLDSLVTAMREDLLGAWHKNNTNFSAIISTEVSGEKFNGMIESHSETPTESLALNALLASKKAGGLGIKEVPNFRARSIFITHLGKNMDSNLSIYAQKGTRRRTIIDNPKRDRYENFESVNEAYVIEDLTAAACATNIKLWDPVAAAWV